MVSANKNLFSGIFIVYLKSTLPVVFKSVIWQSYYNY